MCSSDLNMYLLSILKKIKDFPGGPVVRIPHFQCRGHKFDPWSGNRAAWPKNKETKKRDTAVRVLIMAKTRTMKELLRGQRIQPWYSIHPAPHLLHIYI